MLTINITRKSLVTFAKLNELCDFLFREKKEYEQIALIIPNKADAFFIDYLKGKFIFKKNADIEKAINNDDRRENEKIEIISKEINLNLILKIQTVATTEKYLTKS